MSQRNDQVFQLSLTEIAFMLVFIILLLLGYLVFREQEARAAAEEALAKSQGLEASTDAMKLVKLELEQALSGAGASSVSLDDTIFRLTDAQRARAERDRLKRQVEDLDAQLSAMVELQKVLEAAAANAKQNVAMDEVISALTLQEQVRKLLDVPVGQPVESQKSSSGNPAKHKTRAADAKSGAEQGRKALDQVRQAITTTSLLKVSLKKQLDQELAAGQEAATIDAVVAAARSHGELAKTGANLDAARKENLDLRGQVSFFKRRLEAKGGRDYPPCWATESGSPEYLFSVELTSTGVQVRPSWPVHREADARKLPGIDGALESPVSIDAFVRNVRGIFGASKSADPQCRHYVFLKNTIADALASDRARLTVENYFYKNEVRR